MHFSLLPTLVRTVLSLPRVSTGVLALVLMVIANQSAFGNGNPLTPSAARPIPGSTSARVHPSIRAYRDCSQCHNEVARSSHPSDVRPSMPIPQALPLEAGKLVCTTCHQSDLEGKPLDGALLRDTGPGLLCSQCHNPRVGNGRADHANGQLKAHPGPAQTRAVAGSQTLDEESRSCMSCHDGIAASDVGKHTSGGVLDLETQRDHPVGIEYRPTGHTSDARLKPVSRLDPIVRLFNGTVGCGSCHSVYSKQQNLLVKNNVRSELCLSCHEQ